MDSYDFIGCGSNVCQADHGPKPFVTNIMCMAQQNQNFRTAFWTGDCLQMTLMNILPCSEIGVEMHPDTDQFIRVEDGKAIVRMGCCMENLDFQCHLSTGDAVFVPRGTWHNVVNSGRCQLKLSSFYAPPEHPRCTIHRTKAEAENEKH